MTFTQVEHGDEILEADNYHNVDKIQFENPPDGDRPPDKSIYEQASLHKYLKCHIWIISWDWDRVKLEEFWIFC